MKVTPSRLAGVMLLEPRVFHDARGYLFESYNDRSFREALGFTAHFVQSNHAHSVKHVLRGLHYQLGPPQAKLVRVAQGVIWDVVVDLRRASPTFGQWDAFELSSENHCQLWIPGGFAHGYLILSEFADVLYGTTELWNPALEHCIAWNDVQLAIQWPVLDPVLSAKDRDAGDFASAPVFE